MKNRMGKKKSLPKRKAVPRKNRKAAIKKRPDHYMRVTFGKLWNGQSEIIFFVMTQLPHVLKALKEKNVGIEISRLEPLDHSYTHVNMSPADIRRHMVRFALNHGLHRSHNRLIATIPVKKLASILKDYDVIFSIFFTDLSFHTKSIKIELMDPFFSAFLVKGNIKTLALFEKLVKKHTYLPPKFELVDHP